VAFWLRASATSESVVVAIEDDQVVSGQELRRNAGNDEALVRAPGHIIVGVAEAHPVVRRFPPTWSGRWKAAEKLLLRVRIPVDPAPAVPLWAWVVESVATGNKIGVVNVDQPWTTVAVPITEAGRYRVTAHTHYPATTLCGVAIELEAR
jgi:hypothetical protein